MIFSYSIQEQKFPTFLTSFFLQVAICDVLKPNSKSHPPSHFTRTTQSSSKHNPPTSTSRSPGRHHYQPSLYSPEIKFPLCNTIFIIFINNIAIIFFFFFFIIHTPYPNLSRFSFPPLDSHTSNLPPLP